MSAARSFALAVLLVAGLAGLRADPAVAQASFDCKKAKTKVEKAICGDKETAAIDKKIAQVYADALKKLDPPAVEALKADQKAMLAARDQAFGGEDFSLRDYLDYRQIQLESLDPEPRKTFEGAWINMGGSVTVGRGEKHLEAAVSTSDGTVGRWLCDFTGIAREDGDALVILENPEEEAAFEGWTLRLTRNGNTLAVAAVPPAGAKADDQAPFCGAGGSIAGTFIAAKTDF